MEAKWAECLHKTFSGVHPPGGGCRVPSTRAPSVIISSTNKVDIIVYISKIRQKILKSWSNIVHMNTEKNKIWLKKKKKFYSITQKTYNPGESSNPCMWPTVSSVASPICQEGQSERTFPIFAFSSRFFLFFFLIFPQFLANFSLSGVLLTHKWPLLLPLVPKGGFQLPRDPAVENQFPSRILRWNLHHICMHYKKS